MTRRRLWILQLCAAAAASRANDTSIGYWRPVADRLIQTPPESYPFNWGEGVQQIGVMKVFERTRDARYADWVEQWALHHMRRPVAELLNIGSRASTPEHSGYCGHWSPGTAILLLHEARPKPQYRKLAGDVAAFIRKGAERSPEGGLGHWLGSHQLWVDTLYMACPLLAALGSKADLDDAANQILIYERYLKNASAGLFYHMWDWRTGERTRSLWGRGNGWVLMSIADVMEKLPPSHARYAPLKRLSGEMAKGLQRTQGKDGVWRTVLDDGESYPESSATAMFVYGLLKLIRLGALEEYYEQTARKAWLALNREYVKDGVVVGVSAGTVPKDQKYYRGVAVGSQTWGTGAYLMAGSEVERLNQ